MPLTKLKQQSFFVFFFLFFSFLIAAIIVALMFQITIKKFSTFILCMHYICDYGAVFIFVCQNVFLKNIFFLTYEIKIILK